MCVKNRIVPGLDHLLNLKLFIIEYASQSSMNFDGLGRMETCTQQITDRNPNILRFEI